MMEERTLPRVRSGNLFPSRRIGLHQLSRRTKASCSYSTFLFDGRVVCLAVINLFQKSEVPKITSNAIDQAKFSRLVLKFN